MLIFIVGSLRVRRPGAGSQWLIQSPDRSPQNELAAMERFGEARRGVGLHPAQAKDRPKQVGIEPLLVPLRTKALQNDVDLALAMCLLDLGKDVGTSEITVVLRDLVCENQMAPKS